MTSFNGLSVFSVNGGSLLTWLRLATLQFSQIRGPPPLPLCERFCTSSGLFLQLTPIMAGSRIAMGFAALVELRVAWPIRLGIQQRVQRLLHAAANHAVEVALDPLIINRDDIVQGTRCALVGLGKGFTHGRTYAQTLSKIRLYCSSKALRDCSTFTPMAGFSFSAFFSAFWNCSINLRAFM
jgi:hypothetical protein